jgi:hypothetical protein
MLYGQALNSDPSSHNKVRLASRSGAAAARLLRVAFARGGEGAKQCFMFIMCELHLDLDHL